MSKLLWKQKQEFERRIVLGKGEIKEEEYTEIVV
jgi:hypothetical protein